MATLFLEGFLLQASLIFAVGAQNIFVLEAGLRRQNTITISLVCFLCDLGLIMLGVMGAGAFLSLYPEMKVIIGVIGVGFLFHYGWEKLTSKAQAVTFNTSGGAESIKRAILMSLTFSLLNPHAYLDAFVLIGGYSSKYALMNDRMLVGLGAGIFSLVWFLTLSTASSVMKPVLDNPRNLKRVMSVSGLLLIFLSWKLGQDVLNWIDTVPGLKDVTISHIQYPVTGQLFTTILF